MTDGGRKEPPSTKAGAWCGTNPIGAPSAGLSLGGLHACRARLRFTRHGNPTTEKRPRKAVCSRNELEGIRQALSEDGYCGQEGHASERSSFGWSEANG